MKIKGIYTPIVTPFGKNNEIDYESLETILKFLLKKQIHGIVVGGTTGEYFSLNFHEFGTLQNLKSSVPVETAS